MNAKLQYEYKLERQGFSDRCVHKLIVKGEIRTNNEIPLICCSQLLEEIINKTSFVEEEAKLLENIDFQYLRLSNWKFFLQSLSKYKAPIKTLSLFECYLTDQGAEDLGWMLDNRKSKFEIESLNLCYLDGSNKWIPGFYKNTSTKDLLFANIRFWHGLLHFIRHGKANLERVDAYEMIEEEDQKPEYTIDIDPLEENNYKNETSLKELTIIDKNTDLSDPLFRKLGDILRRCHSLQELNLTKLRKQKYDFVQDALHCQSISFRSTDFDPAILSTLIRDRCLKSLKILTFGLHDRSVVPKNLLNHIDFMDLDKFAVDIFPNDEAFDSLCHQLASNRGPRHLCITIICAEENAYMQAAETLKASLKHNDKVQELELDRYRPIGDHSIQGCCLYLELISTMPALVSFTWKRGGAYEYKRQLESGMIVIHPQSEHVKQLVLQHVAKSKTIRHVCLPFFYADIEMQQRLQEIPYRQLMKYQNKFSDGVWAHALKDKKTPYVRCDREVDAKRNLSVMYSVVCQVPWLFRQAGDSCQDDGPQFIVPHHPNCPACAKRQKKKG